SCARFWTWTTSLFSNARRALDADGVHGYSPNHRPESRLNAGKKRRSQYEENWLAWRSRFSRNSGVCSSGACDRAGEDCATRACDGDARCGSALEDVERKACVKCRTAGEDAAVSERDAR